MSAEEKIRIPAAPAGLATRVSAGRRVRVINRHGSQVLDTWAFNAADGVGHASGA